MQKDRPAQILEGWEYRWLRYFEIFFHFPAVGVLKSSDAEEGHHIFNPTSFETKVNQPIQLHPCISSKSGRKHSQVLIKYLFLALAFFEVPSWCLNPSRDQGSCLTREGLYSWNIPLLPFQVSNAMLGKTSVCVFFFFFSSVSLEVATTIFQK